MCTDYIHQNTDNNPIHPLKQQQHQQQQQQHHHINGVINENNQTRRAV